MKLPIYVSYCDSDSIIIIFSLILEIVCILLYISFQQKVS